MWTEQGSLTTTSDKTNFFHFLYLTFSILLMLVYFGCRCHYHRRRLHSRFSTQRCLISNTSLKALHFDARRHRLPTKSIWHRDRRLLGYFNFRKVFLHSLSLSLLLFVRRLSLRISFNKIHWYLWHNVICFNQCAAIRLSFVPINLVCLRSISCFHSLNFSCSIFVSFIVFVLSVLALSLSHWLGCPLLSSLLSIFPSTWLHFGICASIGNWHPRT